MASEGFPPYDLEKLVQEAKVYLKEQGQEVTAINIYKTVPRMRSRELRRARDGKEDK